MLPSILSIAGADAVVVGGRQRPLVGLSCGSYGACLCDGSEFTGTYGIAGSEGEMSEEQLRDYHWQRLAPVAGDRRVRLHGRSFAHEVMIIRSMFTMSAQLLMVRFCWHSTVTLCCPNQCLCPT